MNPKTEHDYYQVLGISTNSSPDQIKEAYRASVLERHPDKNNRTDAATEATKLLNEAYHVLKDDTRRKEYDVKYQAQHHQQHKPFSTTNSTSSTTYNASNFGSVFERFEFARTQRHGFAWAFEDGETKRKLEDWKRIDTLLCIWTYGAYSKIKTLKGELRPLFFDTEKKREKREALAKAREEHRRLGEESMRKWRIFWMADSEAQAEYVGVQATHQRRQQVAEEGTPIKEFAVWKQWFWICYY